AEARAAGPKRVATTTPTRQPSWPAPPASQFPPQSEDGQHRKPLRPARLAEIEVIAGRLGVGAVGDVLHVEVEAEHPARKDPAFVEAYIQLAEEGIASRVDRTVDGSVTITAAV